jgi:hypothetical protein
VTQGTDIRGQGRLPFEAVGVVLITLFLFLKAYGAAKFSLTTASALLTDAPLSVLLATLVSYAYYVLPVLSLASLSWAVAPTWSGHAAPIRYVLGVFGLVAAALSPLRYLVFVTLGVATLFAVDRVVTHLRARSTLSEGRRDTDLVQRGVLWLGRHLPPLGRTLTYYFILLGLLVFALTLTRMWTPVEVVTVRASGAERLRLVAHVVSNREEWTTLLTADSRQIVYLPEDDVEHRQICHHPSQPRGARPLIYQVFRIPYSSPNTSCTNICSDPARAMPPLSAAQARSMPSCEA